MTTKIVSDFVIKKGSRKELIFRLKQADGNPKDLSTITEAKVSFLLDDGTTLDILLSAPTANGSQFSKDAPEALGNLRLLIEEEDNINFSQVSSRKDLLLELTEGGEVTIETLRRAYTIE